MIVALYRMYYGEDYIIESIRSIINQVDHIYIGIAMKPWSEITEVNVRGNKIKIPVPIDRGYELAINMSHIYEKVHVFPYHQLLPDNQFTKMYEQIQKNYDIDTVILMEPDMVWPEKEKGVKEVITALKTIDNGMCCTYQVEHWKTCDYMIPVRKRPGAILYDMNKYVSLPHTGKNGMPHATAGIQYINYHIHNYGFCLSPRNMWWKHWIGVENNKWINDSQPDPDWFDAKWISWDFENNNIDLEISKHYKHLIPGAIRYDQKNINYPGRHLNIDWKEISTTQKEGQ